MNKTLGRGVIIYCHRCSERFIIYTEASKIRTGRGINGKWEIHFLLLAQANPRLINCTHIEGGNDYSGNPKG